jgi:transcriptional regulator with XRE-family HTH domain
MKGVNMKKETKPQKKKQTKSKDTLVSVQKDESKKKYGEFLLNQRTKTGLSMRKAAGQLGILPGVLNDTEKGRKPPFSGKSEEKLIQVLQMDEEAVFLMRDYAAMYKKAIPTDIHNYARKHSAITKLMREAPDEQTWEAILETLNPDHDMGVKEPLWNPPTIWPKDDDPS